MMQQRVRRQHDSNTTCGRQFEPPGQEMPNTGAFDKSSEYHGERLSGDRGETREYAEICSLRGPFTNCNLASEKD
jgi:hypothetical protein